MTALDCRQARHAAKQVARRALREQAGCKIDEGPVNIVLRDCRGNAVDVSRRHFYSFATMSRSAQLAPGNPAGDLQSKYDSQLPS
jgi:hypothetical protein